MNCIGINVVKRPHCVKDRAWIQFKSIWTVQEGTGFIFIPAGYSTQVSISTHAGSGSESMYFWSYASESGSSCLCLVTTLFPPAFTTKVDVHICVCVRVWVWVCVYTLVISQEFWPPLLHKGALDYVCCHRTGCPPVKMSPQTHGPRTTCPPRTSGPRTRCPP